MTTSTTTTSAISATDGGCPGADPRQALGRSTGMAAFIWGYPLV